MSPDKSAMLGLRTTIYKVNDIEKARDWYASAFDIKPYFDEPYYVGFNIGGFELGLQPSESESLDKEVSVISYWGVNDIHISFKRLLELGAIENQEPTNVGGELMVASVKDPFGNCLGIIYNPYFKIGSKEY